MLARAMDEPIRESLRQLGITPQNYRVLMLLPLVYVAWADNLMEDVEIERIDELAKKRFLLGPSGLKILDGWLEERPSRAYFQRGLEDLFMLAQTDTGAPFVHPEELHELLEHSESIARATARALDAPSSVGPEEEKALGDIAKALHVDNGMSWRQLLDELDAGPASVARQAAKKSEPPPKKKKKRK